MNYNSLVNNISAQLNTLDPASVKNVLRSLARQREMLGKIIQCIQDGIIAVSSDGKILFANNTAEEMLDFELSRFKNHNIELILPGIDCADIARNDNPSWEKKSTAEIEIFRPKHRILQISAFPLEKGTFDDSMDGFVAILRDVTREKVDEEEYVNSEHMQRVRTLAGSLAHEIGNPLNAISLNLQLLAREMKSLPNEETRDDLEELVQVASDEVKRLDTYIRDFLRALRPGVLKFEPCNVLEVLAKSLRDMKPEIEEHRILVSIDHPEKLPVIQADNQHLQHVFFNLIKNAIQAMKDQGKLMIRLYADDRDVSISFRDNGEGISKDFFEKNLFKPLKTTKTNGNGYGLSIIQRTVQEHGGRIDVSSKPGEGTCFTLVLPIANRKMRLLN